MTAEEIEHRIDRLTDLSRQAEEYAENAADEIEYCQSEIEAFESEIKELRIKIAALQAKASRRTQQSKKLYYKAWALEQELS
jgi:polyhydroxyalkanoate synthesis regulator phasin